MDKSLRNSIVIGSFLAAALLTIFVPDDENKDGSDSAKDKMENVYKQEKQGLNQSEATNQGVAVSETLEGDPYEELNSLIGLEDVKKEVRSLANFVRVQKQREKQGLKSVSMSYHCVFTGNPGTGKTTIARILARIFKDLGVVKKGHLVETDRSGLVAEYVGQTAVKTNAVVDSALGGVLFIDEAYALTDQQKGGDYGGEAISTLLKRMEDDRDNLIVIVAGYTNEMKRFVESNPGLQSRFTRYIDFPDYSSGELFDIFKMRMSKYSYKLDADAEQFLRKDLANTVAHKSRNFGNARYVRNLFEKAISNQANRLASQKELTTEELSRISLEDITDACKTVMK